MSVEATVLFEVTPLWTGIFTADATSAMIGPHATVVKGFHLDVTAAGLRNVLTVDEEIIVRYVVTWSKGCSTIVT